MNIFSKLEAFVDGFTMYRLTLYSLVILAIISFIMSGIGLISLPFLELLLSFSVIGASAIIMQIICVKLLNIPVNAESYLITALILFFIVPPIHTYMDIVCVTAISITAIASKFIITLNKRHIINPVAFALFIGSILNFGYSAWWVASPVLLPFTFIITLLITAKLRKWNMVILFILVTTIVGFVTNKSDNILDFINTIFNSWPVIFFAGVMFTEPFTTPVTKVHQYIYAIIVGILFGSKFNFGVIHNSPELSLVIGNIVSYFISKKYTYIGAILERKALIGNHTEVSITKPHTFSFLPGQYVELTFPHKSSDNRGVRRWLSIVSAPNDTVLKVTYKTAEKGSTFKQKVNSSIINSTIGIHGPMGEFILKDYDKEYVFIAGGIGITPFISIISDALYTNKPLRATVVYATKTMDDTVYSDILLKAKMFGIETIYTAQTGSHINTDFLSKTVANITQKYFYISGPHSMVNGVKDSLIKLRVSKEHIVTDYFSGL